METVFEPMPCPSLAIAGIKARFPVRRIFCAGRNYADHVKEMGNDPKAERPVFFSKPADAIVEDGAAIAYPMDTADLHHEVELVLALASGGTEISRDAALDCIWGYAVGVDLTRRDRQGEAKKAGAPWDAAKGFDNSAPIGALTPVEICGHSSAGRIWLSVNGAVKQDADLSTMIWNAAEIIAFLSRSWELKRGDVIFTGTPAGVGPLKPCDQVACGVEGLETLRFSIAARA
jgi:fumarylpyruvate hydrolase